MGSVRYNGKKDSDPTIFESDPIMAVEPAPSAEKYGLSVQDLLRVIWRRFWVIALTAVLLTGIVVGLSLSQEPVYEASIKILIRQQGEGDTPPNLAGDVQGLQQLTLTMAEAIDTRPVAQGVIQEINQVPVPGGPNPKLPLRLRESPEDLLRNLSVDQAANTQFIEVSYTDTNREKAQRIVNAFGDVFSEQVSDVTPTTGDISATVWEPAVMPVAPVSPNPVRNGLLALIMGGMLGVGLAFLLEHLDDSWRSPEEAEQISGVPTFGVIPTFESHQAKKGSPMFEDSLEETHRVKEGDS